MNKLLMTILFFLPQLSLANFYLEADLLHPTFKFMNVISSDVYDFRAGWIHNKWDFSLRYHQAQGVDWSGGIVGTGVSISKAEDSYISGRLSYDLYYFNLGFGLGSYSRSFNTNINGSMQWYNDRSLGKELFIASRYQWDWVYLKSELNITSPDILDQAARASGPASYNIKYPQSEVRFFLALGIQI